MNNEMTDKTIEILDLVATERGRQELLKSQGKFDFSCADPDITHAECLSVLCEEVGEAGHEVNEGIGPGREIDKPQLLKELIQAAAVAVAWAEKVKTEIETFSSLPPQKGATSTLPPAASR